VHRFQMEPTGTEALDRLLRFNEDVLRYLLVRKDE
jgi:ribosomal protein S6